MRILIRGAGLLGTSLGLGLSQAGAQVFLEDVNPDAVATAEGMGAGSAAPCPDPDVVFISVPPEVLAAEVSAALRRFPAATVSDVGSVKSGPLADLGAAGVDLARYVPGHPMAGREVSGPAAGRGDLFEDRPWILTPTAQTDPARLQQVAGLAEQLRAVVRMMHPEEHDRAVALCSHAPQVVASLLAGQLVAASAVDVSVAGPGVRDTTRIAGSDPELWAQILLANADHVAVHLALFSEDMEAFRSALAEGDAQRLRSLLRGRAGAAGRAVPPRRRGRRQPRGRAYRAHAGPASRDRAPRRPARGRAAAARFAGRGRLDAARVSRRLPARRWVVRLTIGSQPCL